MGGGVKDEAFVRCFDKKKEALYANLLTCVFSASATLVLCKRKVHFVFHQLQYYEMVHRCSLKHPCQY